MQKILKELGVQKVNTKQLFKLYYDCVLKIKPTYFCELGAREASASLFLSKNLNNCQFFAYEANPYVYEKYKTKINKQNEKINYINLAISDHSGLIKFYIQNNKPKDVGNNSLLERNNTKEYEILNIQCNKLDDIIYNDKSSYALWIDVEGCGYEVLIGADKILNQTEIIIIEVESVRFWKNQKLDTDIGSLLTDKGFIPLAYDNQYYDKQYNVIFIKNKEKYFT